MLFPFSVLGGRRGFYKITGVPQLFVSFETFHPFLLAARRPGSWVFTSFATVPSPHRDPDHRSGRVGSHIVSLRLPANEHPERVTTSPAQPVLSSTGPQKAARIPSRPFSSDVKTARLLLLHSRRLHLRGPRLPPSATLPRGSLLTVRLPCGCWFSSMPPLRC